MSPVPFDPARGAGIRGFRSARLAVAVSLGLLVATTTAWPEVVVVTASRDNTLFQDAEGDTSNGAGPACFAGTNGQNLVRRALLRFELGRLVPAGVAIDRVELALEVSSAPDAVTRVLTLHRVLSDWGEGPSSSSGGGGAPATPGDATWLHRFHPELPWIAPGGDFDPIASADTSVGDVGRYVWTSERLCDDVRRWLAEPDANHGWLLRGEESGPRTVRRFDSREAPDAARRPTLTIYYSQPVPARTATWGGLKSLYR